MKMILPPTIVTTKILSHNGPVHGVNIPHYCRRRIEHQRRNRLRLLRQQRLQRRHQDRQEETYVSIIPKITTTIDTIDDIAYGIDALETPAVGHRALLASLVHRRGQEDEREACQASSNPPSSSDAATLRGRANVIFDDWMATVDRLMERAPTATVTSSDNNGTSSSTLHSILSIDRRSTRRRVAEMIERDRLNEINVTKVYTIKFCPRFYFILCKIY
uniref:Uncharacterized protein n=1 Tax=Romanomermis culicivorax TaxID=13658 RepID=A0A915HG80_ROMCU